MICIIELKCSLKKCSSFTRRQSQIRWTKNIPNKFKFSCKSSIFCNLFLQTFIISPYRRSHMGSNRETQLSIQSFPVTNSSLLHLKRNIKIQLGHRFVRENRINRLIKKYFLFSIARNFRAKRGRKKNRMSIDWENLLPMGSINRAGETCHHSRIASDRYLKTRIFVNNIDYRETRICAAKLNGTLSI